VLDKVAEALLEKEEISGKVVQDWIDAEKQGEPKKGVKEDQKSGVSETITVGALEINEHIGRIDIRDEEGNELEEYYLDLEDISAIIPK